MKKILLAYFLLLIDLELALNMGYFSVLLPLVCAWLLIDAFGVLANENEQFEQCVSFVVAMAGLRLLLFVVGLWLAPQATRFYIAMLSLSVLCLFFVMTQRMLCAFHEIERENHLFAASLFCMVGAICLCTIGVGCIWATASPTLGVNFLALSCVASALFLLALYQLQVVYARFEKMV